MSVRSGYPIRRRRGATEVPICLSGMPLETRASTDMDVESKGILKPSRFTAPDATEQAAVSKAFADGAQKDLDEALPGPPPLY